MGHGFVRANGGLVGAWFALSLATGLAFAVAFEGGFSLSSQQLVAAMIAVCGAWMVGGAVAGWRLRAGWWVAACPAVTVAAGIAVVAGVAVTIGFRPGSWTPFVLIEGALILAALGLAGAALGVVVGRGLHSRTRNRPPGTAAGSG